MKVYEIIEYRNCEEHYSWGIYSTEENARKYLKFMKWDNDNDFEIIEYKVDENMRWCNNEENNKNQ